MSEGLTARVNLRVLPTEREQLMADAKGAGLSMSELVRRQYFRYPIVTKTDLNMINELRRIGGLLKHTLSHTKGEASPEVREALHQVTLAIKRIHSRGDLS